MQLEIKNNNWLPYIAEHKSGRLLRRFFNPYMCRERVLTGGSCLDQYARHAKILGDRDRDASEAIAASCLDTGLLDFWPLAGRNS